MKTAARPTTKATPANPMGPGGLAYVFGRVYKPGEIKSGEGLAPRDRHDFETGVWSYARAAFAKSLAEVLAGRREIRLLADHDHARVLAGTRDRSLLVWTDPYGLRWRLNTATVRGRASLTWLRANPSHRSVSKGGKVMLTEITTYDGDRPPHVQCAEFVLEEISFVRAGAFKNSFTVPAAPKPVHQTLPAAARLKKSSVPYKVQPPQPHKVTHKKPYTLPAKQLPRTPFAPRSSPMQPSDVIAGYSPEDRLLLKVAAREKTPGRIFGDHFAPELVGRLRAAGLVTAVRGSLVLTAAGRARAATLSPVAAGKSMQIRGGYTPMILA